MISLSALGVGLSLLAATPPEADGKTLFSSKKCTMCHSVASEGIKALPDTKMTIVDLSGLSARRTADWLKAYLDKKEKLEGRAHPPRFKGEAGELDALVKWMMTIKPAA